MANEAVKVELTNGTGNPRRFTCADTPTILKGTLCKLTSPRTAAASTVQGEKIAGIASMDKLASDGSTSIALWTDGIFDMYASGAITVGDPVVSAGGAATFNGVSAATSAASGACIIGYALKTAADTNVINIRVRL